MFKDKTDQNKYIRENYPEVTDRRIKEDHWDFHCSRCSLTRGFQLTQKQISGSRTQYASFSQDFDAPVTYTFRCPVCHCYKQWIVYEIEQRLTKESPYRRHFYRVTCVPSEGIEDIAELPEEPISLRTAYRQAIRAMDANAPLAAAAMFRRAVQVITREMLGAKRGNLANELKEIVGKQLNGATITNSFSTNAYVIKEAGNQGAHPDADPDLLDFSPEDAVDLQQIFMELVSELFVVPAAIKKTKEEFLARRKIDSSKAATI